MSPAATTAYRAYALLMIVTMCWGANAVAGKLAVGHISPLLLTQLRWGLAGLAALPFAWPYLKRDWPLIKRHIWLLLAYGGFGFACFNAALYSALNYTSTINVVIEQAGMPMVIFALNFVVLRQAVRSTQLIGFFMTVVGVALTVSGGQLSRLLTLELNRGDALMLLAIVFYGGYTAGLRARPPVHWLSFITMVCTGAFLVATPFAVWEAASGHAIAPDLRGALVVVFAALFPGLIAQSLFIRSNELIGSNRAGLFVNLVPVFGTLFSILFVGEMLHAYHVIAMALVLAGIALAERRVALG